MSDQRGLPLVVHHLPPEKFPMTIRLLSRATGDCLWLRRVREQSEAVVVPGREVLGEAVRVHIAYADGTSEGKP